MTRFLRSPYALWIGSAALAVVASALLGLLFNKAPALYQPGSNPQEESARINAIAITRTTALAGFPALVAIGGLIVQAVNSRTSVRALQVSARALEVSSETSIVSVKTYEVTERGHFTDRYSAAIEHLGSNSVEVSLGGIYSLEQLALDSGRESDQSTVTEVLSAYVRLRSRRDVRPALAPNVHPESRSKVAVQAALTVLGRLPRQSGRDKLVRADLSGAYLPNFFFTGDYSNSSISGADLRGSRFERASFDRADLSRSDLTGSTFYRVDLSVAFNAAGMSSVSILRCNCRRANFSKATLEGAEFIRTSLTGADFSSANLARARMQDSGPSSANFTGAITRDLKIRWSYGKLDLSDCPTLTPEQMANADLPDDYKLPGDSINWAVDEAIEGDSKTVASESSPPNSSSSS